MRKILVALGVGLTLILPMDAFSQQVSVPVGAPLTIQKVTSVGTSFLGTLFITDSNNVHYSITTDTNGGSEQINGPLPPVLENCRTEALLAMSNQTKYTLTVTSAASDIVTESGSVPNVGVVTTKIFYNVQGCTLNLITN